jgi:hypothetical protein
MSKQLKYVIIDSKYPILFGDCTSHSDFKHMKVTSAGFCSIQPRIHDSGLLVDCYGKSDSLGISSDPEQDQKAIMYILNQY